MITEQNIIFKDNAIIAINKPAGLLVHPSELDPGENIDAMKLLRNLLGTWVYPLHRLDKSTSGILLFAFTKEIAAALSASFENRVIKKNYIALVRGFTQESETIDYPLKKLFERKKDKGRARPDIEPQQAITSYQRLATVELPIPVYPHQSARYSLLTISPLTGRLRQIRRHMKHIFHHIIGDRKHGDRRHNLLFKEQFGCHRMLLHASAITFAHPATARQMTLQAPVPPDFLEVLRKIGINPEEFIHSPDLF